MTKKNTTIKILLGLSLSFILIMAGIFYYVSQKISPEEIRKVALEVMQKTFPGAHIRLDKIDYSLGPSVKLILENFQMTLKEGDGKQHLMSVKEMDFKIPLWAIFTDGGTIMISIDNPDLSYTVLRENMTNWQLATQKDGPSETPEPASPQASAPGPGQENKKIEIMNFFANSKVNVKLTNLNIDYALASGMKGKVTLSRFLIKNLNLKNSTAFELASTLNFTMGQDRAASLDALVIGQINVHELMEKKDLHSSMIITLDNIAAPFLKQNLPTVKTDVEMVLRQADGSIEVAMSTDMNPLGNLKSKVVLDAQGITISDLVGSFSIADLLSMAGNGPNMVEAGASRLELNGGLNMKKEAITPNLEFVVNPGIKIKAPQDVGLTATLKGALSGKELTLYGNGQMLSGNIDVNVQTEFDLNHPPKEMAGLSPIKVDLLLSNIRPSESFIQKILYAPKGTGNASDGKSEAGAAGSVTQGGARAAVPPQFPPVVVNAKWNHLEIGGENFSGSAKIGISKNQIATDNLAFTFSEGKGSLTALAQLLANQGMNLDLDFQLTKLNLDSLRPFLPKNIDKVTGIFSGNVKGKVQKRAVETQTTYHLNADLEAQNGEVRGVNITQAVDMVLDKVPILKEKVKRKDYKVSNNFEKFKLKGTFEQDQYALKNLYFLGIKKQVEINGQGQIFPLPTSRKSYLELDYVDHTNALAGPLEEISGGKVLPLRLSGQGFSLMPDIKYTMEKLSKLAFQKGKNQVEAKVKEEVEKKVKEELGKLKDKFLKGDEEKEKNIKKLFKGLFQ